MNRPSTATLERLIRTSPLGLDDWFGILEEMRVQLRPLFEDFSLPKLSETSFLNDSRFGELKDFEGGAGLSGETQGIYGRGYNSHQRHGRFSVNPHDWQDNRTVTYRANLASGFPRLPERARAVLYAWGLTRDAEWVLIQIAYRQESGYKDRRYDKALEGAVRRASLGQIMTYAKVKPIEIRERLLRQVDEREQRRRQQWGRLQNLQRMLQVEEMALAALTFRLEDDNSYRHKARANALVETS